MGSNSLPPPPPGLTLEKTDSLCETLQTLDTAQSKGGFEEMLKTMATASTQSMGGFDKTLATAFTQITGGFDKTLDTASTCSCFTNTPPIIL